MSKIFEVAFKLGAELTASFQNAFNSAEKSMSGLAKAADKLNSMGKSLSIGVTAPLVGVGAAVVKIGADFDSQMSKVSAVSQATGEALDALRQQSQDLGSTTKFTATQVAEGQEYLALAGYNTQQILGATEGVLNLAAAGAMDLGQAADITSDVMSAFGMKAEEAGHAADVFAYAQANANTNVEQAGEAMKYLAPLANQMGWSMEESAAAVMKLADNGLKGSVAGQAFASSIARLAKPTKEMQETMNKLGLSFFDAQGNMKSLPDVVKELETGTKGLTMQQKSAAISTIFGAEAYKHWAILLESGSDTLAQYTEELQNSDGTAQRMADTMVDNLAGSLLMLRSALEGVAIQLSDLVKDDLRTLVDYLTKLTGKFGALSDSNKKMIILVAAIAASIGPLLVVLSVLITSFINVRSAIMATGAAIKGLTVVQMIGTKIMNMHRAATLAYALSGGGLKGVVIAMTSAFKALNLTLLANPIFLATAAVVALGAAFFIAYKKSDAFKSAVDKAFSSARDFVMNTASFVSTSALKMWDGVIKSASELPSRIQATLSNSAIGQIIGSVFANSKGITDGLLESIASGFDLLPNIISKAASSAMDFFGESLSGKVRAVIDGFITSFQTGLSSLPGVISMIAPMMTTLGLGFLGVSGPVGWLIGAIVSIGGFLFRLSQTNDGVASAMSSAWQNLMTAFAPLIKVFSDGFSQFAEEVGPQLSETIAMIATSFAEMGPMFAEVGVSLSELAVTILSMWSEVGTTLTSNVLPMLLQVFKMVFPMILQVIQTVLPLVIGLLISIIPVILQLAQAVIPMILQVIQMVFPIVLSVIQMVVPLVIGLLTSVIPIVLQLAQLIIPMILQVVQTVFPIVLSIIQTVLPIFVSLLTTVIGVILQLAQAVIPMILQVVQMVFPIVLSIIQMVIPIITVVLQTLITVINGVLIPAINAILAIIQFVFPLVQSIISTALAIVNGLIQTAMALLKGDWDGAWSAIKETAETIMDNIISFFKGINLFEVGRSIINGLIDGIKSMGGAILGAIGNLIPGPVKGVISSILPEFFADGGIVNSPTLAWVGEGGDTETVIPWNNSQRSKDLWLQTGRALGMLGDTEKTSPDPATLNAAQQAVTNVPVTNNVVNMMDYARKVPSIEIPQTPVVNMEAPPAEIINLIEYINKKPDVVFPPQNNQSENPVPTEIRPEQVKPANEGGPVIIHLTNSPQYHISGGDPEEVQRVVENGNDDLLTRINELEKDQRRLAF